MSACNENGFSPSSIWIIIVLAALTLVAVFWGCTQRYVHIKHMVDAHGLRPDTLLGTQGYKRMRSGGGGGRREYSTGMGMGMSPSASVSTGCRHYSDGEEFGG